MKLNFKYSKEKDIENFLKSRKAVNRKTNTKTEEEFLKYHDDFNEKNLSEFIDKYTLEEKYHIPAIIKKAETQWSEVEEKFVEQCEGLFKITYPVESVTVFFSLNGRGTYNLDNRYFFTSVRTKYVPKNVMHELLHFYTWEAFGKEMIQNGYDTSEYNKIKESLTVLLNVHFQDLMNGEIDEGYPQHQELRTQISALFREGKSIKEIVQEVQS